MVQVDFCNPANNETPLASLSFLVHAHLETISRWVDDFEMGAVAVAKKPKAFDVALTHVCDWETGVSGFLCLGRLFQGQPNEAALCI